MKPLFRLAIAALILGWIAAAVAALTAKRRIVPIDDPDADEIALVGIFGPIAFRSTAESFRGGTVECRFGGGMIDLRSAQLDPAGATLTVNAILGGAQILVPGSWRVSVHGTGILGGVTDARPEDDRPTEGPELWIDATSILGGLMVTTQADEAADRWFEETMAKAGEVAG